MFFAERTLNRHLINSVRLPGWYRRSVADLVESIVFAKIRFVSFYPTACLPGYRVAERYLGLS